MKCIANISLLIAIIFSSPSFATDALSQQRSLYDKWNNVNSSLPVAEQKKLLDALIQYPLYPYAKAQFLQNNIQSISTSTVTNFIKENKNSPLKTQVSQQYLAELTRRKDWKAITSFPKDNSTESLCRYQFALFQLGKKKAALEPVSTLWMSNKNLPSACDDLISVWQKAGGMTADLLLQRISIVIKQNNTKLARSLISLLPNNYKTTKSNLLAIINDPKKIQQFSAQLHPTPFTKKVILATFPRLARSDTDLARKLLPQLKKRQKLSPDEVKSLEITIANYYLNNNVTAEQIKWRDNVISKNYNLDLLEKRIRLAISNNNYTDINFWIGKLKPKDQSKDDWQYWKARALLNKNKNSKEAYAILEKLSKNRGFYPILSAQLLQKPYTLKNKSEQISDSELSFLKQKYDNIASIKLISELRYWGKLSEANSEWRNYLYNLAKKDKEQYAEAAKYAYTQGWGDLSIQATILGKLWDNWTERLPVMYESLYSEALKDKEITLSYALAITRQESALNPTVRSPVGASGLMQLMPDTAEFTAKKLGALPTYSKEQLFNPQTNIQLGTHYLNFVYLSNNNNRILSSAAYNAGPHRVKRWLEGTKGKLDAAAFIETIPFTETRNYVKSVLVYDYLYQKKLNSDTTAFLQPNELNQRY